MNTCPCGSGRTFDACCEPLITGKRLPATAEELMRARYSAYATVSIDYILDSTHPEHRGDYDAAGTKKWAAESEWEGLEIVETRRGGPEESTGEVEFIATFSEKGLKRRHHELASFTKVGEQWYFVDGRPVSAKPAVSAKIGRNEPCPCGSGAKHKKCCGK